MMGEPDRILSSLRRSPGPTSSMRPWRKTLRQRLPGMWEKVGRTEVAFYLGHRFGSASLLAVRRKASGPTPT